MNLFLLALAALCPSALLAVAPQSQEDEVDAHGYDKMRIEQEDKLLVPADKVEEVWEYLRQRLTEDKEFLTSLDPKFTSKWSEELFHDTYFDTPSMQLYAMKSGVRHRTRENLSNPDDVKSGRQLMQIKLNDISSNDLERGEIKYEIERIRSTKTAEDRHPMIGRVKPEHRKPFTQKLGEIGLDPESMRAVLTVRDIRRRIYILKDGQPFMSISHDQASAELWWGRAEFCELEPELNEIGFTEADEATRTYMESILARVVGDILTKFPEIQRNLTPKYNKAFDQLEADIPYLRSVVGLGLQDDGGVVLVFGGVLLMGAFIAVPRLLRAKRRSKRAVRQVAAAGPPRRESSVV